MFDFPVVFVDIETTGGGYRTSRILEIAAIRYENGVITDEFTTLIDPETHVPYYITKITGITTGDVDGAPKFADITQRLSEILEGAVFVAHNVNFDYSFIKNEFAMLGIPFSMKRLCTVRLSRALYAEHKGHSLQKLIERHDIPFESRHRAYDDAKALLYFAEIAHAEHGKDVCSEAISKQLKTQSVPVNLEVEDIKSVENTPGVYIFKDENDVVLYVGKSVTMRNRVMSHFQDMSAKEVKLAQKTTKIESIETGNELLALLLESRLVKKLSPVFNRQLRRVTKYCMLVRQIDENGYAQVSYIDGLPDTDNSLGDIYGLYENRTKAKKWAEVYGATFDLCPKLMGLEKSKGACFRYGLGKCRGACHGKETPDVYNARFEVALEKSRLSAWPYEGEIILPLDETGGTITIENWIIKQIEGPAISSHFTSENYFDLDEYKILKRFFANSYAL
jgi:DNA polymerase-3 subunit epsilon